MATQATQAIKAFIDLLNSFMGQARFISFTYTDKKHGETARRVLTIGADYKRLIEASKLELELRLSSLAGVQLDAANELLASFTATLNGTQTEYTKEGQYVTVANGVKLNLNDNTLELCGLEQSKAVLKKGIYKPVKSSAKTLAKQELRKGLPVGKYKTLCLDVGLFHGAKLNGETIELEPVQPEQPAS